MRVKAEIPRIIAITNRKCNDRPLEVLIKSALDGGVPAIMLREKDLPSSDLFPLASRILALCRSAGALLIINRYVDLALAIGADGVHLGYDSPSIEQVRHKLDKHMLLGISAHNLNDLEMAAGAGADYATLSPVFSPTSKTGHLPALGLKKFREMAAHTEMPIIALGGVNPDNAEACIKMGASGIAAIGAIFEAKEPDCEVRKLIHALKD